jgi:hypothetical protein
VSLVHGASRSVRFAALFTLFVCAVTLTVHGCGGEELID